jgi:hypothetical protein
MTLDQFAQSSNLISLAEADRVCHVAFYYLKTKQVLEFTAADATRWMAQDLQLATPNASRLKGNLQRNRCTVKGSRTGSFRLERTFISGLEAKFPQLSEKSQEVVEDGSILPKARYEGAPGYIESLARQMNASYEHNIFDGCAVLMRRLLEVLLILSYEHLSIADEIRDSNGNYRLLDGIIDNAKNNKTLALARNSKSCVDEFRRLGNFSAHKIRYNCTRDEIKPRILDYRALIEELLYKSGIKR